MIEEPKYHATEWANDAKFVIDHGDVLRLDSSATEEKLV